MICGSKNNTVVFIYYSPREYNILIDIANEVSAAIWDFFFGVTKGPKPRRREN